MIDPRHGEAVDLVNTLDLRALTAGDRITLGRLKGPKFFEVDHYPTVCFTGHHMTLTGERTAVFSGELTVRGVTRPASLSILFARPAQAKRQEDMLLRAETAIDRTDFGMTAYRLIVGRKVTITIDTMMVPDKTPPA